MMKVIKVSKRISVKEEIDKGVNSNAAKEKKE
jgi:hypothetical protein